MMNKPDSAAAEKYARAGGFALKSYFLDCIRHGSRADIETRLITSRLREQMEEVFEGNLEAMLIGVMLSWAQYARAAVEGGVSEVDASQYYVDYILRAECAESIQELTDLSIEILKDFADATAEAQKQRGPQVLVIRCRELVQEHIYEKITVQFLADQLHFSRGYFSQRFRDATGITISKFIQQEKIEEAKRLLQFTSLPIVSIGTRLGFCSQSHFTAAFKQVCGMTPGQYRDNKSLE